MTETFLRQGLIIELLEPAIFTANAATEAAHDTVHVIPGSALLGAAASRLYATIGDTWNAFHSGAVRFEDGLPMTQNGAIAFPMPNSLHFPKRTTPSFAGNDKNVVNGTVHSLEATVGNENPIQFVQLRENFLTSGGELLRVKTLSDTKSAIAAGEMRASDGQLFVYRSIAPGQRFYAEINGPKDLVVQIVAELCKPTTRLGRSKSAEFGAVRVSKANKCIDLTSETAKTTSQLTLWCLSPLALIDANGFPTLTPTAKAIGLGKGTYNPERSFVRFTTLRSFNQHRNCYDVDRPVLQRGSVLVIDGVDPDDVDKLAAKPGIGLHQALGYGRVWVNPKLLSGNALEQQAAITVSSIEMAQSDPEPKVLSTATQYTLLKWMETRAGGTTADIKTDVDAWIKQLTEMYRIGNRDMASGERRSVGPSPSQWGKVMEAVKSADSIDEEKLFDAASGLCKANAVGWQDKVFATNKAQSFHDWFKEKCSSSAAVAPNKCEGKKYNIALLRLFTREAMRVAKQAGDVR
jgi:CRISPR-associated protein Csx10